MIGYQPRPKGLGVQDRFKSLVGARPSTWRFFAAAFRPLPTLAKLCKFPVVGHLFKWVLMFSPYEKRYTQGVTLPLNIDISDKSQKVAVPIEMMKDAIRKASYRLALSRCLCRDSHNCKRYSHEIACIFLGDAARATEKHGLGRVVDAEEACALVDRAAAAGLVGQALWVEVEQLVWGFENEKMENFLEFCFCCECCCTAFNIAKNATKDVRRRFKTVGWQAQISDECSGCGLCAPSCPHKVITIAGGRASSNSDCIGCGICVTKCKKNAIKLELVQPLKPEVKDYFEGLRIRV
jgi:ferredoxin